MTRDGKLLVYAVSGKKDDASGVWAAATSAEAVPTAIRTGGKCQPADLGREADAGLVFLQSKTAADPKTPAEVRIAHWKRPTSAGARRS
ncbi:MAG: hypothetical protein U0797_22340 [Gemmataceae bacterium]